jgi:quercetin dioxygenase-like cupin family protein
MPSGAREVRHYHTTARQFFYVLEGTLTMEVDGQIFTLPKGYGIQIEPGQRHQAENASGSAVRMLVISQPASHGDRVVV